MIVIGLWKQTFPYLPVVGVTIFVWQSQQATQSVFDDWKIFFKKFEWIISWIDCHQPFFERFGHAPQLDRINFQPTAILSI